MTPDVTTIEAGVLFRAHRDPSFVMSPARSAISGTVKAAISILADEALLHNATLPVFAVPPQFHNSRCEIAIT